jgi:hypothetical protein
MPHNGKIPLFPFLVSHGGLYSCSESIIGQLYNLESWNLHHKKTALGKGPSKIAII